MHFTIYYSHKNQVNLAIEILQLNSNYHLNFQHLQKLMKEKIQHNFYSSHQRIQYSFHYIYKFFTHLNNSDSIQQYKTNNLFHMDHRKLSKYNDNESNQLRFNFPNN